MEAIGATMEGEWSCLSGMFTNEEADFMAQLLGNCLDSSSGSGASSGCNNSTNVYNLSSNYSISSGNSFLNPCSSQESYHLMSDSNNNINPGSSTRNRSISFEFYSDDHANTSSYLLECPDQPDKNHQTNSEPCQKPNTTSEGSKKRPRGVADNVEKGTKRNVRSKKNQKADTSNKDEECNGGINGPAASSSCCSEDDSNGLSLNLSAKTRASRGAATDPQSLYARKRRERINERLRILQNLVPNGTKVDISTMLEEAVHYVKFLQLQIKLLSSDDLWMYAPIAYNGMDIGLDLNLITASQ